MYERSREREKVRSGLLSSCLSYFRLIFSISTSLILKPGYLARSIPNPCFYFTEPRIPVFILPNPESRTPNSESRIPNGFVCVFLIDMSNFFRTMPVLMRQKTEIINQVKLREACFLVLGFCFLVLGTWFLVAVFVIILGVRD